MDPVDNGTKISLGTGINDADCNNVQALKGKRYPPRYMAMYGAGFNNP